MALLLMRTVTGASMKALWSAPLALAMRTRNARALRRVEKLS
jgi:hypothetical protein